MKRHLAILLTILVSVGCGGAPKIDTSKNLVDARKAFTSKIQSTGFASEPAPNPDESIFKRVAYESAGRKLVAYLSPAALETEKRPAIVWITGGDCNSIDDVWSPAPRNDDQTAAAYRKAGIVMMFPSLRGGNQNPGQREGLLGEVDDVLAAADYLAKQPGVDPQRIYLGGHSTGGTLTLLVAECSPRFRAVFSFGPVDDVSGYERTYTPFPRTQQEIEVRSPIYWLHSIKSPVFVIEGAEQGNADSLRSMAATTKNPQVHFITVKGRDHFSVLAPANDGIAKKILADTGETSNLTLTEADLR